MKQQLKSLFDQFILNTYKTLSPQGFPAGLDVASDIKRVMKNQHISTIFDVGANEGQFCLYFQKNFPQSIIYSFEPVNETFAELEKNTSHLKNINRFNHAFGNTTDQKQIYLNNNSGKNSLVDSLQKIDSKNENSKKSQLITIKKIDDFCSENKIDSIDIIKTDTEGFDLEVIKGASSLLEQRKINFIITEMGFSTADDRHTFLIPFVEYLYPFGFRFYGIYDLNFWKNYQQLIFCNVLFVNYKNIQAKIG